MILYMYLNFYILKKNCMSIFYIKSSLI